MENEGKELLDDKSRKIAPRSQYYLIAGCFAVNASEVDFE